VHIRQPGRCTVPAQWSTGCRYSDVPGRIPPTKGGRETCTGEATYPPWYREAYTGFWEVSFKPLFLLLGSWEASFKPLSLFLRVLGGLGEALLAQTQQWNGSRRDSSGPNPTVKRVWKRLFWPKPNSETGGRKRLFWPKPNSAPGEKGGKRGSRELRNRENNREERLSGA